MAHLRWCAIAQLSSDQIDLEVRAVVVVLDPRGSGPLGEVAGAGVRDDVTEPGVRVRLEPAMLHAERALATVVGTAGDPLGRDVGTAALDVTGGHEQGGRRADD